MDHLVRKELAVLSLSILAMVALETENRQERACFLEERGGVLWEQQAAICYSVLTNQICFYPVPSNAL